MSVLAAALISFFSVSLLCMHLGRSGMMKLCGYAVVADVVLHGGILFLFIGSSTLGLMQAELAAILFTLGIRSYRYFVGYSRLARRGARLVWVKHPAPSRLPSFLGG